MEGLNSQYSEKVMEHFKNPKNVGEIPNAEGIGNVGNPVCVTASTLIYTNNRIKEIEGLKKGQKVLGHDGYYHKINSIHKRFYRGKIYSILARNIGETAVTPEHHILSIKASHLRYKFSSYKSCIVDWYTPEELRKGDILLYPIPKEAADIKYVHLNINKPKLDFKSKDLPESITIDRDFLRLVGYYLSEGYVRTDRCKGTVGFVFNSKETMYIKDVIFLMKKSFRLSPASYKARNNSLDLVFYSARLARFFEREFGKRAENKCIPQWAMLLPLKKQEALLCGLWRGDGYINNVGGKYVTISRQLAYSIKLLLLRHKIIFSFLTAPEKGIHKESYCIYVKEERSLKKLSRIYGKKVKRLPKLKNTHKSWFDEDFYYTPIRRLLNSGYKGLVYNLEVDEPHSYISNSAILHNCGDIMRLYIKVENDVIVDAKFKTFGCGAAIATSSMVTEIVKGKTIKEALKISNRAVAEALGGLPPIKMHCSVLAEEALKSAIDDYLKKKDKGNG